MTSSVVRLPLAPSSPTPHLPQLDRYLREQQELSAVERFAARAHHGPASGPRPRAPSDPPISDEVAGGPTPELGDSTPAQARYYRDLIPQGPPGEGRQYAFRVDLDACTGCKACVTACHNLNGLDEEETWRSVGLLHGGTPVAPVRQTVTTACHHCVEPACLQGCPALAYEKDSVTGIVKHLDDQCIGCQYCTFTCPYEVPQFNASLGIVRKCDMCSDRLAASEAPACVQACPNAAISITLVDRQQAVEDALGDAFLPGAPSPGITVPTTQYETARPLPRNLLPADFYAVSPSHRHAPLVLMLVLNQLSVGALAASAVADRFLPKDVLLALRPLHAGVAVTIGLVALAASIFHLGRPQYAFRAILGLRTSWMSREIMAFGLFAPLAVAFAAATFLGHSVTTPFAALLGGRVAETLGGLSVAAGLLGLGCSVLVYHATRRAWWSATTVGFKFLMTAVVLGTATTRLTFSVGAHLLGGTTALAVRPVMAVLAVVVAGSTLLKLLGELAFFIHLSDRRFTALKRSAVLMTHDLRAYTFSRFATGLIGGVLLPLLGPRLLHGTHIAATVASLVLLLAGELLERTLFFAAAASPGMPGGLR